ncbi:MAG: VTT domain-containing protein, partial [Pseudolabrys sp.]|nr:VTT domain-containing protein [Pseudolabrys sp.]
AGALSAGKLIGVFWFGSFAGDVIRFYLGRRYGARLFKSWPRIERLVTIAARLTDKHAVLMILFHRYPHGIRGTAAFAYGLSNLTWPTFLVFNFIAAGLWAVAVVATGYAFGQVSETVMNDASSGLGLGMLVIFLGLSWFLSKKLEETIERDSELTRR